MDESDEWPTRQRSGSVTADNLKAYFIQFNANYFPSWLILATCTFLSPVAPAADLINVNSNSLHSSHAACRASHPAPTLSLNWALPAVCFCLFWAWTYASNPLAPSIHTQSFPLARLHFVWLWGSGITWWVTATLLPTCIRTLISSCCRQRGNDAADLSGDDCLRSCWASTELIAVLFCGISPLKGRRRVRMTQSALRWV